jgi:ABC-type uncharacterized transport system auxiliary subunit
MSRRKALTVVTILTLASMVAGCAATAEPETIIQTVEVEKTVIETVEVEVPVEPERVRPTPSASVGWGRCRRRALSWAALPCSSP